MVDSAQLASQAFAKLQESTKWRPGPTVAAVLFFGGGVASWYAHLHRKKSAAVERAIVRVASTATLVKSGEHEKRRKVKVDKEFFRRLATLLKIVLPGMGSKEFFLLVLHTGFLIARTFASIYVASLDGQLVKSIVDRDPTAFMWRLLRWLGIAIPATYINSMIRYLESKLSIAFRTRLVDYVYTLYMRNQTYYRVDNVDGRMQNPDQSLTEDVARFCQELAHLYSQVSKPIFDILLMSAQLFYMGRQKTGSGWQAHYPWMVGSSVLIFTGYLLKSFTPPFGKMVAEEARKYGQLRAAHARIITHSEEIAFYGGHKVEERGLRAAYSELVKQMNTIYKTRIWYTMLEQFLMKYVWGAAGLVMIAIPAFVNAKDGVAANAAAAKLAGTTPGNITAVPGQADSASERTQDYITARSLLVSAADAMERLMSSWKELAELAGHTLRVTDMITVFTDVAHGRYVKNVPDEAKAVLARRGTVNDGSRLISCNRVPVVTPNGDMLVSELSFTIEPGMHLLITGPNGCGKSSLFRIIGGLWPIHGGVLTKPGQGDIFYIPQRPYLSSGTLRDQFIYPHTVEDMKLKGISDTDLFPMIDAVNLGPVVDREGGLDAVKEWRDVLSGGEKQRVGMARLFYHKPKYAILDECTSAVSIDVEGQMYLYAKKLSITLITITHRPTLWQYHNYLLQFDGQGNYKFSELNATARLSLQDEKSKLEASLAGLPKMQERLEELRVLLGEDRKGDAPVEP